MRDSVDRLLADHYGFAQRRGYLAEPEGWSTALWVRYAEQGLLGLPFAEEHGGFGGGAIDVMLVMEAFGRVLALEPYLATVVLGGTALRLAGSDAQKSAILPQVAEGRLTFAFAHGERQARYDLTGCADHRQADRARLGARRREERRVHGDGADRLIVSARIAGEREDTEGIGLFLVDAKANGVARRAYPMRDGTRAAEIALNGVEVARDDVLGEPGNALPVIERVVEAGIAATSAEAVGAMEAMHAMTLEYLKTRQQFGKPIGHNQVLQHRSAEMLIALEQGRSMAMLAAMMVDEPDSRGARPQHRDGQGRGRPGEPLCRAERGPIAWRHRHDRGIRSRPLFPPCHGHRTHVWRPRPPPVAARRQVQ